MQLSDSHEVNFDGLSDENTSKSRRFHIEKCVSNFNILKFGSADIGIFGYNFKGPMEFNHLPKAELLEQQIINFINATSDKGIQNQDRIRECRTMVYCNTPSLNEMSRFPLQYMHKALEELYALNLSEWMTRRMIVLSIFTLTLNIILWPLSIRAFKTTGAWRGDEHVYTYFHVLMGLNSVLFSIPFLSLHHRLQHLSEIFSYICLGMVGFIWGCWHILGGYELSGAYSNSTILEFVSSREALVSLDYIYGFLPIVALDSFLPSRTCKTWWIHLQFVLLYSSSTIIVGFLNSSHIPWIYVLFRITAYIAISGLLFFGSYNSEVQIRVSFYNWLTTSKRITLLERDIKGLRDPHKIATPAERVLDEMQACSRIMERLYEAVDDRLPELGDSLARLCAMMNNCLTHMTTNSNLYSVPYGELYTDLGDEKAVIDAYIRGNKDSDTCGLDDNLITKDVVTYGLNNHKFQYLLPTDTNLVNKLDISVLNDWNFSILGYFRENSFPFLSLGQALLSEFQSHYSIPNQRLISFLTVVKRLYNKTVAYHNETHAIFVAHKLYCLEKYVDVYSKMSILDRGIMIVAALCHDIGHPGRNNAFFSSIQHPVSQMFNDHSILENYHSCCTFNVLKMQECNIFERFCTEEFKVIRCRIIEMILATDMEDHFEIISRFRLRRNSKDFSTENTNDIYYICKMLIKAADISSGTVNWDDHLEWAQRIIHEFYEQGDDERKFNLPVSALCDRTRHSEAPKSQITFLKFVVSPLFEELSLFNGTLVHDICLTQLKRNIAKWELLALDKKEIPLLNFKYNNLNDVFDIAWAIPN